MLSTPYVKIEKSTLENNIARMQSWVTENGQVLRPHIKTHRSVEIAKMQLAAGAVGITCAKLGEAEVMAAAGIRNILIAYSLVGADKMLRLKRLMEQAEVAVTCDNMVSAEQLNQVGLELGRPVPVLVEIMTHIKRGGVSEEALEAFVKALNGLPGLEFRGIMAYSGLNPNSDPDNGLRSMSEEEIRLLCRCRDRLERAGVKVEVVSGGSTVISRRADVMKGLTESRAGNYVFGDIHYARLGAVKESDCALTVRATVVSTPERGLATLDCGSKILSSDHDSCGFGKIRQYPEATIYKLNEEHGYVRYDPEQYHLHVGEEVDVIPYHSCVVANLVDRIFLFSGENYIRSISVDARGKSY